MRAVQDPTHVRGISEALFSYFNKEARESGDLGHYPINTDFKVERVTYVYNAAYITRSDEAREWARLHNWNVVDDIEVVLRKIQ